MFQFKVGDRLVDLDMLDANEGTTSIYCTIVSTSVDHYEVKFDDIKGNTFRATNDEALISEALYNSPLYQALR